MLLAEAQGGHIELAVSDETDTSSITVVLPRASETKGVRIVQVRG